jgi:hypothetical protein
MNAYINIKFPGIKYLLAFLILCQISNAFLATDFLVNKENIALSSDIDNNSKEDKNSIDSEEEIKIFESFLNRIYFTNEPNIINSIAQNFTEVLKTENFPPPEQLSAFNLLLY